MANQILFQGEKAEKELYNLCINDLGFSRVEANNLIELIFYNHSVSDLCLGNTLVRMCRGSYKECYPAPNKNWIMKSVVHYNDSDLEISILKNAKEANLEDVFIESYYVLVNHLGFGTETIDGGGEEVSFIILQPKVEVCVDENYENYRKVRMKMQEKIDAFPIYFENGEVLDFEEFREMSIYNYDWLKKAATVYGKEKMTKLKNFITENNISDLHDGNLGFRTINDIEYPIILDWMSE